MARGRVMSEIKGHIGDNLGVYAALTFFYTVGIMSGIFTISLLPEEQKVYIGTYIKSFFYVLRESTPDIGTILIQSALSNLKILFGMFLCGFTLIGIPFVFLLLMYKGFMVGLTAAALITETGLLGVVVVLLCMLPPNAVALLCYLRAGTLAIENGARNWRTRNIPKGRQDIIRYNTPYMMNMLILFAVCLIAVIIESLMAPFVLKLLSQAF